MRMAMVMVWVRVKVGVRGVKAWTKGGWVAGSREGG